MEEKTREPIFPSDLEGTPLTEREKERYVNSYITETGFPKSAKRIRQHLGEVFKLASEETNFPLVFAGCDHYCSVGEGNNTAIPGADVDALFFLTEREITAEEAATFSKAVLKRVNLMLAGHLTKWNMVRKNFIPVSALGRFTDSNWETVQADIPTESRYLLMEIVHETGLFNQKPPIVESIRNSPLGKTVPPPRTMSEKGMPKIRKTKYEARVLLAKLFPQLDLDSQYAIVRTQLSRTLPESAILDPINLTVGGPETEVLEKLYERGLYYKETRGNKTQVYEPKWVYGMK